MRAELVRALASSPRFLRDAVWRERDADVRRFAAEMFRVALGPADTAWLHELAAGEPDPEVRRALHDSARFLSAPR